MGWADEHRPAGSGVVGAQAAVLVVLDGGEVDDDLVGDMVEVLTSFCARLYGRRSALNQALKALGCAQHNIGPEIVRAQEHDVGHG